MYVMSIYIVLFLYMNHVLNLLNAHLMRPENVMKQEDGHHEV